VELRHCGIASAISRSLRSVSVEIADSASPTGRSAGARVDEEHRGSISFVHYARTRADRLYAPEVRALAEHAAAPVQLHYRHTRGPGAQRRLDARGLAILAGDPDETHIAVCGPPALLAAVRAAWVTLGGNPERLPTETFSAPRLTAIGDAAHGTLRFAGTGGAVAIGARTLLEQAEAAGLQPAFGCRMGICKTCTCRKTAGAVRNLRTGQVSADEHEDIQLCVSVPAGDVALEL